MTTQAITIDVSPRENTTKGGIKKLRKDGYVPAVIYGKGNPTMIAVRAKSLPKQHPRSAVVSLAMGGTSRSVLVREVQINPLTDEPIHIDFQEVAMTDVVTVKVPLVFEGLTREQEKEGSFKALLRSLQVIAPAGKLPTSLRVNVGNLKVDETAHISDVDMPADVKLKAKKNLALASLVRL